MALLDDITAQAALDVAALANALTALTGGQAHDAVFGNGETLTPGVYDVGSAADIQGILTLDAQGDSAALFVFRIGGALSSVAASQVLLTDGATAANVFWKSTGAVGLGANSTFVGTAIAVTAAASLAAASTMTGRLLSTEGAVSIDSSLTLSIPTGQTSIRLGVISTFAMFSAIGAVANTGASVIVGDIGSNSGAVSGFDAPTTVDGNVYTAGSPGVTPDTKELKQRLKLERASLKRQGYTLDTDGSILSGPDTDAPFYRRLNVLDIDLLPNKYSDNNLVNTTEVLQRGRPWTTSFTFYEVFGTTLALETTQYINANTIYAYTSTYDVPSFNPARVVVNGVEVLLQGDSPLPYGRGHNLVVLDPDGNVVTTATQFDTYIDPANLTALASALGAVASGNIVVLVVYDASALNAAVRTAINTGYGSTNTETWIASRASHIFIGVKT
jgi:hypothetical protein